jgi:ATP-dependent RNA helicase DOB1
MKRFGNGDKLPLLDPVEDMEIDAAEELLKARNKINDELEKIEEKAAISEAQKA